MKQEEMYILNSLSFLGSVFTGGETMIAVRKEGRALHFEAGCDKVFWHIL